MTNRLLLVEPSATMRYVLEKHAQTLGFVVDATESYPAAMESLTRQYQQFGTEYSGMLFGWPTAPQAEAASLASLLEQSEYKDLPVVVMSTDMRAETRAWVAGRDNTAVLSWKEYQGLEALLQRLIDVAPEEAGAFATKFDNSDIHLLVVDDSATIRYSLRDLFQMQGYRVSLAATQEEAMQLALETRFDIAILDFYLTETTGDLLCRELMSEEKTGDIVCTVLTGTYSDHIIKRSLRAGAVECMFKNESSELLLSRIDAISRFVRQRRALQSDSRLLEQIIDSVAGAILVLDEHQRICYLSESALAELKLDSSVTLLGQPQETLLEIDGPQPAGSGLHSVTWRLPGGQSMEVDYEHLPVEHSNLSLIRFARKAISVEHTLAGEVLDMSDSASGVNALIEKLALAETSRPLLNELEGYLERARSNGNSLPERVSLFILDVFIHGEDSPRIPVSINPDLSSKVGDDLHAIYRRPGHVARMKDNRFAFLLRHREEAQAYLLVRKIMQLCLEIDNDFGGTQLMCSGSLLSVVNNAEQTSAALIQHSFKGADLVQSRAPNQALLLDLRRMLSAYPAKSVQKVSS